jgi:flagellar basal body rod protein FlgG
LYYGSDPEQNKKLPEFRFLNRFGYVNELFQFLNQDGKPYDRDTNLLINEKGHFINENGERIDKYGNLLDEQGEVIQVHPFQE